MCRTGKHGGINRRFHVAIFLRTKKLGHHHGAAHIAAKSKRYKNQCDLIAVVHRRQGVLTDKLTCHPAIGNIVELLEDDAAEQRQAELP